VLDPPVQAGLSLDSIPNHQRPGRRWSRSGVRLRAARGGRERREEREHACDREHTIAPRARDAPSRRIGRVSLEVWRVDVAADDCRPHPATPPICDYVSEPSSREAT
jgi:hypothetical protein